MKRYLSLGTLLLILLALPLIPGHAARTSLWEINSIKSWLEGEFHGIGLTSDGTVKPTISTESSELPARLAWGSARTDEGTIVATSLPSALYRVTDDNSYETLKKTEDLGFTAIQKVGGYVYAAATPSGDIYRYKPETDKFAKLSTLPDSYVWSMIPDRNNEGLLIGTGPNGNLYHMTLGGGYVKKATIPDGNITSLTLYENQVHMGSDNGSIYRLDGEKTVSVYGFKNGEVSSLAADDAYLYAAVNQRKEGQQEDNKQKAISELARQLKQQSMQQQITESPVPEQSGEAGTANSQAQTMMIQQIRQRSRSQGSSLFAGLNGTMVYRMNPPGKMNVVYNDPQEIVHDLESDGKNLYVATGGSGRLYKVKRNFTRIAHFKAAQKLVLDVRLSDNDRVSAITTGEGATLHRHEPFESSTVTYRSQPLDAHLMAQWGDLKHLGQGRIQIRTRSGNNQTPNEYWSDWSEWASAKNFEIASPPARYLQFEVRFLERNATLREIDIAFLIPNQRPRIANLSVSPNPVQSQFLQSRSTSDNGPKQPQNGGPTGGANQLSSSSLKQRKVSWKVIDPDGDPAQTQLFYKPLNAEKWISFTGENHIKESHYTINLKNLADGQYRLKLTATDRRFNDPGAGFATSEIIGPILVDNTQPSFENFSLTNDELAFRAADETSRILIAQYRINGNHWQTIWPEDKVYDQKTESFSLNMPRDVESGDIVEVRLLDEGGNQAIRRGSIPGE